MSENNYWDKPKGLMEKPCYYIDIRGSPSVNMVAHCLNVKVSPNTQSFQLTSGTPFLNMDSQTNVPQLSEEIAKRKVRD